MEHHNEPAFSRRVFLRTGATVATGIGVAGCTSVADVEVITPSTDENPGENRATGIVYIPEHDHERNTAGTTTSGDYAFGLTYSVPDYFWTVNGETTRESTPADGDNIQLRAAIWAPDTQFVLPDVDLQATIEMNGEPLAETELTPWLNQRWGFEYIANLGLEQYGDLVVQLSTSRMDIRRTGTFRDNFDDPTSVEIGLTFDRTEIQQISTLYTQNSDIPGAIKTIDRDDIPVGRQLNPANLPDEMVASGSSGDADIAVSAVPAGESPLEDGAPYLAINAATPYNQLTLPSMRIEGRLTRDDETVYEGGFPPTLDSERGYHYGAAVDSIESGDELQLSFPTPPQVARFEGYEEAFLDMPEIEVTL